MTRIMGKLRPFSNFLGLLLTVCLAATTVVAFAADTPPPPDYLPLPLEAVWQYKSTTATGNISEFSVSVIKQEKQDDGTILSQVEAKSNQSIIEWYSKPAGWVMTHKQLYPANNQQTEFKPLRPVLKNPLNPGDTWQWEGVIMMGVNVKESSKAINLEPVEVPAGKFSGFKVVTELSQGGFNLTKTSWYADGVGMVKSVIESSSFKTTTELVSYSFKR